MSNTREKIQKFNTFQSKYKKVKNFTDFHCAVLADFPEIMDSLTKHTNIDAKDIHGRTPLILAAEFGHEPAFDKLLELGANASLSENCDYHTPLHVAAVKGHCIIIKSLHDRKVDIFNQQNFMNETALLVAMKYGKLDAAMQLIDYPEVDVSIPDEMGWTCLHYAAADNQCVIMKKLFGRVNVNAKSTSGKTPLMTAARGKCNDAIDMLLGRDDVDITLADENGETALHYAIHSGSPDVIRKLLLRSDYQTINQKNKSEKTPVELLREKGIDNQYADEIRLLEYISRIDKRVSNNENYFIYTLFGFSFDFSFFNFLGWCCSALQEQAAANALKKFLVDRNQSMEEAGLTTTHKHALNQGELGEIYRALFPRAALIDYDQTVQKRKDDDGVVFLGMGCYAGEKKQATNALKLRFFGGLSDKDAKLSDHEKAIGQGRLGGIYRSLQAMGR